MKLTEKECNEAYENLCETFDKYIDNSRKDLFVFSDLIKEHFELVEEYKDCRKELESYYEKMSNPPLKFEEWNEAAIQDWYINSVSEDDEPIWTEKHIEELCKDFRLIKKGNL